MKAPLVIGRVIFGGYFIYTGINHFLHKKELAQYAGAKNLPEPEAAVLVSGAALVAGGASLLLGVQPKLGAAALVGFLAAASPTFHNFWDETDPHQRQNQMVHFGKNIALAGAALALGGMYESRRSIEIPTAGEVTKSLGDVVKKVKKTGWRVLAA